MLLGGGPSEDSWFEDCPLLVVRRDILPLDLPVLLCGKPVGSDRLDCFLFVLSGLPLVLPNNLKGPRDCPASESDEEDEEDESDSLSVDNDDSEFCGAWRARGTQSPAVSFRIAPPKEA